MERGNFCLSGFQTLGQPGDDTLQAPLDFRRAHTERSDTALFEQEVVAACIALNRTGALVDFPSASIATSTSGQ